MKDVVAPAARLFHRFPMLRVDRIIAVEPGSSATAQVTLSGNDALARGAGPFPAMLIVEAMAQVAALFAEGDAPRGESGTLAGLSDFTFGAPLGPGATVTITSRLAGRFGRLMKIETEAISCGRLAAKGAITIAL